MFNLLLKHRSIFLLGFFILISPFITLAANPQEAGFFTKYPNFLVLLTQIIKYLYTFLGGIAILYLVLAGLRYLSAQGAEEAAAAKQALISVFIGVIIIVGAWGIAYLILDLLTTYL